MKFHRQRVGATAARTGVGRWITTAALVAALAFAATLLYFTYGRPQSERTEIIVDRAAAPATSGHTDSVIAVEPNGPSTSGATTATAGNGALPSATPASTARPATTDLLRPGTEPIERLDLSLDGSTTGQIALASRYTVTAGCQPLHADVFSVQSGRWQRVFDAGDPTMAYGALLPPPEATSAGCFPKIRLFNGRTAPGENALLLLAVAYSDTSVRVVVVGWDAATGAPAALFDWRTGLNGTVSRSVEGDHLEIGEDAPPLADGAGSPGRFTQVVELGGGAPSVSSRRLSPNCDRGHVSGWSAGADGTAPERFVLECSSGSKVTAGPADGAVLQPEGITWTDVRDGDSVQVQYDAASLEPQSLADAVPRVAGLTDYAAATRHRTEQRAARPTRTATRSPAQPSTSGQAAPPRQSVAPARQPATAPRAPASSSDSSAPSPSDSTTESGAPTTAAPAAQPSEPVSRPTRQPAGQSTRQPASQSTRPPAAPRPVATAPAPVVSPPPAPRGLPSCGAPRAPR